LIKEFGRRGNRPFPGYLPAMSTVDSPSPVDDYIAGFPESVQGVLRNVRDAIRKAAPGATESITYRMPTFTLHGTLVHFAGFARHVGFYPTPSGMETFRQELSGYKTGKGSVQFPLDAPVPYQLIERIVKFRLRENRARNG
jgi:uncharacterized protein YdhG (YjbR/CyaY superfamily)